MWGPEHTYNFNMPVGVYANGASSSDGRVFACNAMFSSTFSLIVDNIHKADYNGPARVMVLVAVKDIEAGAEIFVEYHRTVA